MRKNIRDMNVEQVIESLKQGEILYGVHGTYEIIDGLFVYKEKDDWAICPVIRKDYDCYFDRPEPEIQIKVGEFYKTRNGLKAYAYTSAANDRIAVVVENQIPYTVSLCGYVSEDEESDLDLVAPYNQETSQCEKKTRRNRNKYNDKEIKQMILQGMTYDDISFKLGINYTSLAKHILRNKDLYKSYKFKKKK